MFVCIKENKQKKKQIIIHFKKIPMFSSLFLLCSSTTHTYTNMHKLFIILSSDHPLVYKFGGVTKKIEAQMKERQTITIKRERERLELVDQPHVLLKMPDSTNCRHFDD